LGNTVGDNRSRACGRSWQRLSGCGFPGQIIGVQTANATEDIARLIIVVQQARTGAVSAIERISGRMQEIYSCATAASGAVEEQNAAHRMERRSSSRLWARFQELPRKRGIRRKAS